MLARKTAQSIIATFRMQPEAELLSGAEVLIKVKMMDRLFLGGKKGSIALYVAERFRCGLYAHGLLQGEAGSSVDFSAIDLKMKEALTLSSVRSLRPQ